jgi:hypothetical protein
VTLSWGSSQVWLFTATAAFGHAGWFAYVMIPALIIAVWGIDQRRAILQHISG